MLNLKECMKLSQNARIVFKLFLSNPFTAFNVNELLDIINRNGKLMSKRTMFRVLKKLTDIGKIHCSDIHKGMRSFELLKNSYYVMNCEKCGSKTFGEILGESAKKEILNIKRDFCIEKLSIDIRGVCGECC